MWKRAIIIYLSPCQNFYHNGSYVISFRHSGCAVKRLHPAMNISRQIETGNRSCSASAHSTQLFGVVRTCITTRRPDAPVSQFTWSSSRSSIWMSCTCSGADCPFPWSGASTSCPLSARCSSSQQLDSSEVELWDASSSDSKDEDEYDLTMIVIVVCGRVVFGDLRVAWTSRACSVQGAHKYLNKYRWLNTNNSHLEFCLSSTEDKDRLLKDLWRLLWRWMKVLN